MSHLLKDLNQAQLKAVTTTEGPVLVIAGAGSGKTRVLTRRLAHILTTRLAEPHQVLAVTFTNKAAGEMKDRVSQLLGGQTAQLQVSTFHSFCARLLRREAHRLSYKSDFTIFDAEDSRTLAKNCIKELGFSESQFLPKGQLRKISDLKGQLTGAESFTTQASGYFETRTAAIYSLYQKRLRECNAMDFDDLLFNTVWLLQNDQEVGDRYRWQFKYVMVDEYQDTNHVQYLLLKALLDEHRNICVVGDEDQSIYGWRGADIRNILEFERDFPGAKIIKLEQNYRSTAVILKAASAVIQNNEMRKDKTLRTDTGEGDKLELLMVDSAEEEASHVIEQIMARSDPHDLKETVILYRTNAQSRPFEEQLRRRNVPYQIFGGISFYERKEIKDLVAYLKLIANPADDVSFERIVNYPKRGIGTKTLAQIATLARVKNIPYLQVAVNAKEYPELAGKLKRLEPFVTLIGKYSDLVRSQPVDLITQDLVEELEIIPELLSEDPIIGQTKVENIEAFIEGTVEYARANAEAHLTDYLSEISLFTDLDSYRDMNDKLTLMTMHSAKGLEYDTVYLVGLEEGLFPLQRAIADPMELEEERRLFYVGITRAREKVCVSLARARFRFGEVEAVPSRFVSEIPEELINKHDFRTHHLYDYSASAQPSRTPASVSKAPAADREGTYYEYEEDEMLQPGRIVSHPTFGRGKIITVEGFGESLRLQIMFSGLGLKKIMAKYAKLKVIG